MPYVVRFNPATRRNECIFSCVDCGAEIGHRDPKYRQTVCDPCKAKKWRRIRALRRAHPIRKAVRDAVIARDGMWCRHCGVAVRYAAGRHDLARDTIQLDHLIPISRGGLSTVDNLVVSCLGCNCGRGDRPLLRELIPL